jgi:Mycobacterium membrane protein
MIRLFKRTWVPLVMVIVVAIASFTVSRLHGIFGSNMYRPDVGNADAIVQFNPKRVLYEIFGLPGTVADINYWMRMLSHSVLMGRRCHGRSSSSRR